MKLTQPLHQHMSKERHRDCFDSTHRTYVSPSVAWIEYVKTPSRRKLLIGFPIKSFINKCNCQLLCVSILREPTSTKMSWKWPINCSFYVKKQKPLLKLPSHCFWLDYNLSKHLPVEFATFLRWEGVLTNWNCRNYCKMAFENAFLLQKIHKNASKRSKNHA